MKSLYSLTFVILAFLSFHKSEGADEKMYFQSDIYESVPAKTPEESAKDTSANDWMTAIAPAPPPPPPIRQQGGSGYGPPQAPQTGYGQSPPANNQYQPQQYYGNVPQNNQQYGNGYNNQQYGNGYNNQQYGNGYYSGQDNTNYRGPPAGNSGGYANAPSLNSLSVVENSNNANNGYQNPQTANGDQQNAGNGKKEPVKFVPVGVPKTMWDMEEELYAKRGVGFNTNPGIENYLSMNQPVVLPPVPSDYYAKLYAREKEEASRKQDSLKKTQKQDPPTEIKRNRFWFFNRESAASIKHSGFYQCGFIIIMIILSMTI